MGQTTLQTRPGYCLSVRLLNMPRLPVVIQTQLSYSLWVESVGIIKSFEVIRHTTDAMMTNWPIINCYWISCAL